MGIKIGQSQFSVAKVKPEVTKALGSIARSEYDFVWAEELDTNTPLTGIKSQYALPHSPILRAASIGQMQFKQSNASVRKQYLHLAKKGMDLAGKAFPGELDSPINAMNLIVASSDAFDAWSIRDQTHVYESTRAYSKVLLSAFDFFEPYFPAMQSVKPYKQIVGVAFAVADSVYLVSKESYYTPIDR